MSGFLVAYTGRVATTVERGRGKGGLLSHFWQFLTLHHFVAVQPFGETGLGVSGIHLEKTQGNSLVYAIGTISNLTSRQRFGVKVELDLLDGSGQKIGTARDYQQVIEPNEKWQFRALVMDSKATTAKIASIKEDQ